ncbi:MAG: lipopolysaccharide biosynthesis protein [Solirubrobacteraceae bacterium]
MTRRLARVTDVYRRTAVSLLGSLGIQAMLLISGILAARLLGVANRGHLALYLLFVLVLSQLAAWVLPLATTYRIARDPTSARATVKVVTVPALMQAGVATWAHALILAAVFRDSSGSVQLAAALTLFATPAVVIHQYVLAVFQGQQRFRAFSIFRFMPSAVYSAGLIVTWVLHSHALVLVTGTWVASVVFTVCVEVVMMLSRLPEVLLKEPAAPARGEMLRFGLKGMLGGIAPLETFNLDQATVGLFVSPAALGLYVIGLSLTNLPQFLAQSVGYVAYPHVAGQQETRLARRSMWRFFGATFALSGAVIVVLEIAAPWLITTLFGRSYASSAQLTRILLIGALFIGLRRVLTDGARGAGHPTLGTLAELVSLGCLLPALALLVASDGVQGAAWAVVLSSVVGLLFLLVTVAKAPSRVVPPATRPARYPTSSVQTTGLPDGPHAPPPTDAPARVDA